MSQLSLKIESRDVGLPIKKVNKKPRGKNSGLSEREREREENGRF